MVSVSVSKKFGIEKSIVIGFAKKIGIRKSIGFGFKKFVQILGFVTHWTLDNLKLNFEK